MASIAAVATGGVAAKGAESPAAVGDLRREPYLLYPTSDGITIRWRTDSSIEQGCVLRYGGSVEGMDRAAAATIEHDHYAGVREWQVTLTGLEPDTQYYYAIEADGAMLCGADDRHWFRTSPRPGATKPMRFWLFGDSGSNRPRATTVEEMLKGIGATDTIRVRNGFRKFNAGKPLDGIILLGDNAYPTGTDEQYQAALFNVFADELAHAPVWPCTGNHDIDDAFGYVFSANQRANAAGAPANGVHYYSTDLGNVHLVVLDPWKGWLQTSPDPNYAPWKKQLAWLEEDLAQTKQHWIVVVNHFPIYCDGNYNSDNEILQSLRTQLVSLLDRYGVDFFLAGHDHTYQRSYLLRDHTGARETFDPLKHLANEEIGRDRPIVKKHGPNSGAIYIVSGTGGGSRLAGAFAHPAMIPFETGKGSARGVTKPGSLVMEFEAEKARGWQIDIEGKVVDQFEVHKTASL